MNLKSNDDLQTFIDRVFEAIVARASSEVFSYFCHRFKVIFEKKEPYQCLMLDWLSGLSEIPEYSNISRESILVTQIFFGIDNRTWQEVGELLLNAIDSPNLKFRACAAHQIGKFSNRLFCLWEQPDDDDDFSGMILVPEGNWEWCFEPGSYEKYAAAVNGVPPLLEMFAFFQTKELDRSGVLYPWLSALKSVAATNLDISAGVVEILKQSPASAPDNRYFPITLRALAQERFCDIDAFRYEMSQVDYQERCIAIRRLIEKLKSFLDRNDYLRVSLVEQIEEVFQVVTNYIDPDTFAVFCFEFHDDLGGNKQCDRLIILWLERLLEMEEHPTLTKDDVTAAQIFFGVYNTTWQAVGEFLITALDSHNPNLRSCAAYQLGIFSNGLYCNLNWLHDDRKISPLNYRYGKYLSAIANYEKYEKKLEGIPPLAEMLALIGAKEIEHPGLACAWMSACQVTTNYRDTSDWMINILGKSSTPETFTSYFPFTLGFLAHEWFSDNPVAIRRLIDVGRIDIACAAATDDSYKNEEIEPLLIEIGNDEDPENVRIASWHLAYNYHYLHPHGVAAGYVESIDDLLGIDMYLLFSRRQEPESPYAVVIYPKDINGTLSGETANYWIDRIFPESVRGAIRIEECDSHTSGYRHESGQISYRTGYTRYRSGFVNYRFPKRLEDPTTKTVDIDPYENKSFVRAADSDKLDSVMIGYRSSVDWNPRKFL